MGSRVCIQGDIHRDQKVLLCQDHPQRCRGYRIDTDRRFEIGETLQRLEGNSVFETSFTGDFCSLKEFACFFTGRKKTRLSRRRHERKVIHFARLIASDSILTKHHPHSIEIGWGVRPLRGEEATNRRNLGHDTFNTAVEGGDLQHVPPRERETPDADPFRIDLRLQLQPSDGVAVVLLLVFGEDLFARSAFALSEVTEVEEQNSEAGVCESLRVLGEPHLLECAYTVRHSDRRQLLALCCGVVIGKIKEAGTIQPFALEYNFLLHVCSPQLVEWAERKSA